MNGMDSRDQGVTAVSEPVRHQVHHSYIWLGTLRVVLAVFSTPPAMAMEPRSVS